MAETVKTAAPIRATRARAFRSEKANYKILKQNKELKKLSDSTLKEIALIIAENIPEIRMRYVLTNIQKDNEEILGTKVTLQGKQWEFTNKDLNRFKHFLLTRIQCPQPYSPGEWKKTLTMVESIIRYRELHKEYLKKHNPSFSKRKAKKASDIDLFTSILKKIAICINDDLRSPNSNSTSRFMGESFKLTSEVLKQFHSAGLSIFLNADQIKGRVNKSLPAVKK